MQEHASLLKAVVDYKVKTEEFERMLLQTTIDNVSKLTVKQLEVVIWAVAKRLRSEWTEPLSEGNHALLKECQVQLIDVLKSRSASMKPRGVAFAIEAVSSIVDSAGIDQ